MSIVPSTNDSDFCSQPSLFDFPFPFSRAFPLRSRTSRVDWTETPLAHVLTASLSGEDVLVQLVDDDDTNKLQVSTESGNFSARFALPADASLDRLRVSMHAGLLTVTIPKQESPTRRSPNVRVVQITGDD